MGFWNRRAHVNGSIIISSADGVGHSDHTHPNLRSLSVAAYHAARKLAEDNGWKLGPRITTSVDATWGFAARVESRYEIAGVARWECRKVNPLYSTPGVRTYPYSVTAFATADEAWKLALKIGARGGSAYVVAMPNQVRPSASKPA